METNNDQNVEDQEYGTPQDMPENLWEGWVELSSDPPVRKDRPVSFRYAKMWNSNLTNLDLSGADFSYADLRGSRFDKSNLTGADFSFANLSGTSFMNANLKGANMTFAQTNNSHYKNLPKDDNYYHLGDSSMKEFRSVKDLLMSESNGEKSYTNVNSRIEHIEHDWSYSAIKKEESKDVTE